VLPLTSLAELIATFPSNFAFAGAIMHIIAIENINNTNIFLTYIICSRS
jgi:hypothetical protein